MIHYSTNWMGPVSTAWYEKHNVPYVLKMTSGKILPAVEYKKFLESYSCGRIDIYGLDDQEYWGGKTEYSLGVMNSKSWNLLSEYCDNYVTTELKSYDELVQSFEKTTGHRIDWFTGITK